MIKEHTVIRQFATILNITVVHAPIRNWWKVIEIDSRQGCFSLTIEDIFSIIKDLLKLSITLPDSSMVVATGCEMLQLPRETVVEKLGEFKESYGAKTMETLSEAC